MSPVVREVVCSWYPSSVPDWAPGGSDRMSGQIQMASSTSARFVPLVIRTSEKVHPPLDTITHAYTPSRVDYLIRIWPHVWAASQAPHSAQGLMRPGETREAPRLKRPKGHYPSDHLIWADVVSDIEHAWYSLLGEGQNREDRMRWLIIGYRLSGLKLGQIGSQRGLRVRTQVVVDENKKAVMLMAEALGYVQPPEETTPDHHQGSDVAPTP